MTARRYLDSPLGKLMLEGNDGVLQRLTLCTKPELPPFLPEMLDEAAWQLMQYFSGQQRQFWLPVFPEGTEFQKKVWNELKKIPDGQTITYGELARRLGCPRAVRAVGQAVGRNPIPIIIPCHRVVAAKGPGGYRYGPDAKRKLLELEGCSWPA